MTPKEALEKAIDTVGSQLAVAAHFRIKPAAITGWKKSGVPADRVLELERLARRKVTRHQLRPDVFGPPRSAQ